VHASVAVRPARSPRVVRQRLRLLADRYTGGKVIHMRQDPVPWAYRVFYRQVGIDPDSQRTPVERVALERLQRGGFESRNLVDDALTIAIAETGVPVIAFDAAKVGPTLGLRLAGEGERLGSSGHQLSLRQIVVADERRSLAVLFGEIAEDAGVVPETERMVLAALRVRGVPQISLDEALWTATEVLQEAD
jgi:DNA/RNA-binding domain of Phe-tRNA-synthetase-like protein